MKKVILLFLLQFVGQIYAQEPSQSKVRSLYVLAAHEETSCRKLLVLLKSYNELNSPVLAGYRASATMMMANYVHNPFRKYANFKEGKILIEKAIAADKNNAELRFLRFSIQTNAPAFLNYSNEIDEDKKLLMNALRTMKDPELKQLVLSYLNNSEYLTKNEKQELNT